MIKDIDSFFELFNPKNKVVENPEELTINEYIFNIKMFSKLIIKSNARQDLVVNFAKELRDNIPRDKLLAAGIDMVYNRAFLYVELFNINNHLWVKALHQCVDVFLITSIQICKQYFEDREEYEKCAVLQKILEESLKVVDSPKKNS
jgi:hypothetical protein